MLGRLFVFLFLLSIPLSAQETEGKSVDPKSYSESKFFYSIGTEWFNLYSYGRTEEGYWNYTSDFLPSSLTMEFRQNIIEHDSAHTFSIAFAPQFGVSIFTASDELAEHAALPLFFQYNTGLGATHKAKGYTGYSFGIGPSLNILNAQYYLYNPRSFIAIDFQYTQRQLMNKGIIKFNYIRFGIDPSGGGIPDRGFHVNFGVGRTF